MAKAFVIILFKEQHMLQRYLISLTLLLSHATTTVQRQVRTKCIHGVAFPGGG